GRKALGDTVAGGAQHPGIDAQLATVGNADAGMGGLVGLEHRWNIVLGVAGSKQHAGDGKDMPGPLGAQPVETVVDDRIGEFEVAVFDRNAGKPLLEGASQGGKFVDGAAVAAAMAAEHDTRAGWQKRQIRQSILRELRTWPPIWVGRTGRVFQPHDWAAARTAVVGGGNPRGQSRAWCGLPRLRMQLKIIRENKHLQPG